MKCDVMHLCVDFIQTIGNLIERRLYETKENKQVPHLKYEKYKNILILK